MNNIKAYRESAGYSQESLAARMGLSQQAIAKWETGEAMPRADKLPELARTLGRTIDELFGEGAGASEKVHKK